MIVILKKFLLETIMLTLSSCVLTEVMSTSTLHKRSDQFKGFIINRNIRISKFLHNLKEFLFLST